MRHVPGIQVHQGENNRDQVIIRGNGSSVDVFLNGVGQPLGTAAGAAVASGFMRAALAR